MTEPGARAVLLAMATFANETGAFVIAEGIEDIDMLDFLRRLENDMTVATPRRRSPTTCCCPHLPPDAAPLARAPARVVPSAARAEPLHFPERLSRPDERRGSSNRLAQCRSSPAAPPTVKGEKRRHQRGAQLLEVHVGQVSRPSRSQQVAGGRNCADAPAKRSKVGA
jgi:hypothetical protein